MIDLTSRGKEFYLKAEDNLAAYAQKNEGDAITRVDPNDPDSQPTFEGERVPFQLDRDKIIHSRAFRRLMHKTQVLTITKGDHFRTRLTHTLEVSQIARSISKLLGLNEELTEAIALGHDLGHTPFGHIGERTLHNIISGKLAKETGVEEFGGFKHNFQSVHIADNLEQWSLEDAGFNLTLAVRDGIIKHTKLSYNGEGIVKYPELKLLDFSSNVPFTLEGQVVKLADDIAQTTHDLEDGFRLGIIKVADFMDFPLVKCVCDRVGGKTEDLLNYDVRKLRCSLIGPMVGYLIHDSVEATLSNLKNNYPQGNFPDKFSKMIVTFKKETDAQRKQLADLITELFLTSLQVSTMDSRAEHIVKNLFKAYWSNPAQLPDLILTKYFHKKGEKSFSRMAIRSRTNEMQQDPCFARSICDHIASMTDNYAFSEYKKLYLPE